MPKPDPIAKALVSAALELYRRQLWLEVPADAPFLLRVPGQDLPLVASIMGHMGQDYGLFVSRGEHAFETLLRIFATEGGPETDLSGAAIISVTVQPLGQIEPPLRGLLEAAGLQMRRESLAPLAMSYSKPAGGRSANRSERKLLLACVRAVLAAHDAGVFAPPSLDRRRRRIFEIVVEEAGELIPDTRVRTHEVPWPRVAHTVATPTPLRLLSDAPAPGDDGPLPATLDEWKEADRVVTERLVHALTQSELRASRLRTRFFGSEAVADEVLLECAGLRPADGLVEWAIADYRPAPTSKTLLERRLDDPATTPVERAICLARLQACLSVYRVLATRPGSSFDVEDVLSGERLTIEDRKLSASDIGHCFVTLRVFRVGRWDFCALAGPPISALDVDRALARLDALGADLSPGGLRRTAHLVGRLWEFALPSRQRPMKLSNTDGDPYEFHTATFRVADAAAAGKALDTRKDLTADGDGEWSWLRPEGPAPGLGDNTILGRLQFLDDRLVLEVNSSKRLAKARKWIERLPGVRFEQATVRAIDAERAVDDRLPSPPQEPPSAEAVALVEQMLQRQFRAWLDERVPLLGNVTPRAAARTAEGRHRVARMIRTMPDVKTSGKLIPAPREWLLRELGIGVEGPTGEARG
jgi:hypothetical protein